MDVRCDNSKCKHNREGICVSMWDISIEMKNGVPVCDSCEEKEETTE